ncbi:MAG: amino acid ABC transporter permease [Nocardioidaceae bacterium]
MSWVKSERQLEREALARKLRLRSATVAVIAALVVFGVLYAVVVTSPGWPTFKSTFLSWSDAKAVLPDLLKGFWLNVKIFLIAEPLILVVGVIVAVIRSTTAAAVFPLRLIAVVYTDLFRGLPTILVVMLLAFGMPALQLTGMPNSLTFWSIVALVLSYGAYVAEVFRAGIDSVHPSQLASAQSLGLSHAQTMYDVILPQATRRVIPPLLNDFISLQKDTALVVVVGLFDITGTASDTTNFTFNFTPMVVAGLFFVALTVPLARFVDWLQRRARLREWGRTR